MNISVTLRIYEEELSRHLEKGIHYSNAEGNHFHTNSTRSTRSLFATHFERSSPLHYKDDQEEDFSHSDESVESVNEVIEPIENSSNHTETPIVSLSKPLSATLTSTKIPNKERVRQLGMPPITSIILYPDKTTAESSTNNLKVTSLTIPTVLVSAALDIYGTLSSSQSNIKQTQYQHQDHDLHQQNILPLAPLKQLSNTLQQKYVLLLTLQSGRFAAAIFHQSNCIQHTTSTRYTTRKGQGKSQKSNDNAKGKAKSIGSQLRRAGAEQLRNDVSNCLKEWYKCGVLQNCLLFFLSVSKTLQKEFWMDVLDIIGTSGGASDSCLSVLFSKKSKHVVNIPLDVGRPSYNGCCAIHELLTTCSLQNLELDLIDPLPFEREESHTAVPPNPGTTSLEAIPEIRQDTKLCDPDEDDEKNKVPLSLMHKAVQDGDIDQLLHLLSLEDHLDDIDVRAGPELQTPLHLAAALPNATISSKCIRALLLEGHANPGILDGRNRPPYFLASSEPARNAFRIVRSKLHDVWDWEACKVGPALTEDELQKKKEKASDKKRKQRERQKERKAEEEAELQKEKLKQEEEAKAEEAKRIRDGLNPKPNKNLVKPGEAMCDFCQLVCKRKTQMFQRLDYHYCSTECVKRHQRELMAAAATARLGK